MKAELARLGRENSRLKAELAQARRHQKAAAEVLKVISGTDFDLQAVLGNLVESVAELCNCNHAAIYLLEGNRLQGSAFFGATAEEVQASSANTLKIDRKSISGRVALSGQREIIEDIRNDPEYDYAPVKKWSNARALMAVPLLVKGRVKGVVSIARPKPGKFTKAHMAIIEQFADQAMIAIGNARLFDEVRSRSAELAEALKQQTATASVLKTISKSFADLPSVLNMLVATAAGLCGAQFGGIVLCEDGGLRGYASISERPDNWDIGHLTPIDRRFVVGRVVLEQKPVYVPDVEDDPDYDLADLRPVTDSRAMLGVPLFKDGTVYGVLFLGHPKPDAFNSKHRELLETYADQTVIAIENARLFNEVRSRTYDLTEALKQQTATSELLKVIGRSTLDLQPVFDTLAESAARLCEAERAFVFRFDGQQLNGVAWHNTSSDLIAYVTANPIRPGRQTAAARSALERRTIHIHDVQADPDYAYALRDVDPIGSVLAVPMLHGDALLGVVVIYRLEVRPFSIDHVALMETFSDQAVIAIENSRLFEEVQVRNRELTEALGQQMATGTILRAIAASPTDVQPVLDTVAESAATLCEAYDTVILLVEGDALATRAHHGPIPLDFAKHPLTREWVTGRAVVDGMPIHVHNLLEESKEYPAGQIMAARQGHRTILAMPLMHEGKAIGAVTMRRREVRPFSQKQIDLLKIFADQAAIAIHNVRLFEEVRARTSELTEALKQQTATADVLKAISQSTFDLDRVLQTLVESASSLCGATFGGIFMRKGDKLRGGILVGGSEEDREMTLTMDIAADRSTISGRVVLSGQVEHIADLLTDGEYKPEFLRFAEETRAMMGVPLLREGRVEGVFVLGKAEPGAFGERLAQLIRTFADQAVIAIKNSRLFEEVQASNRELTEALEQQTVTSTILRAIAASPTDIQPVLNTVAESAATLCDAYDAAILLKDGDSLAWKAHFGPIPIGLEKWPIGRDWATGRAFVDRRSIHIEDALNAGDDLAVSREMAKSMGFRSILSVPLMREGEAIGVIGIRRREARKFTERQIRLAEIFADQAVIAIENVRLFEEVQARTRELTAALEQQTATADVLQAISRSAFDLDTVLQTLMDSVARLCNTSQAQIWRRDGDIYRFSAGRLLHPEYEARERSVTIAPGRSSVVARVALEKRPVQVPDIWNDPDYAFKEDARVGNIRSVLGVPLLRDGEVVGVFTAGRTEVEPYTDQQIALMTTFADQAVIAIENVRLFQEVQFRTRELQESLEYQTATSEVLNVISRSPSQVQPVLDAIVSTAGDLCKSDYAYFFMLQPDGKCHVAASYLSEPKYFDFLKNTPIGLDRSSATGRAMVERRVIHIPDILTDPEYDHSDGWTKVSGILTYLSVPLLRDGEPIGAITAGRKGSRPFAQRQIDLIETFADQAVIAIENARLFEEVQARTREVSEALQQQTATAEVLKSISSSAFDLDAVLGTLVKSAAELCHASFGIICLRDGDVFRPAQQVGFAPEFFRYMQENPFHTGHNSVTGRVGLTGGVVHIADVLNDPDYSYSEGQKIGGYRAVLGVPLLRNGEVKGSFALGRIDPLPYTQREIDLVQSFADQAVIAIENVRLFEEAEQRNRELMATSDVLRVISRSPTDAKPVFDVLAENATRLCDAQLSVVYRFDGRQMHLMAYHGLSSSEVEVAKSTFPRAPDRISAGGRTILTGRIEEIPDTREDSEYWQGAFASWGSNSVLAVPMLRDNGPIGAIVVDRRQTGKFPKRQVDLLKTFADQAVIAIENVRLFEEVQARTKELQESLEHQTATGDVLNVISRSPTEVEPVLDTIVQIASRLCEADSSLIFRLKGGAYHVAAASNADDAFVKHAMEHPIPPVRGAIIGRTALERRTVHVPDCLTDPEYTFHDYQRVGGYRSVLGVPLLRDGEPIGVIGLMRTSVRPYTEKQIELVTTFADQAVIAIENARLFEEVQASTRELTRSVGELKALGEVSQSVNSSLDLKTVLETIVTKAVQLSETDAGTIYVYSKSADRFRPRANYGLSADTVERIARQPITLNDPGIGEAAKQRKPVQVADLSANAPMPVHKVVLDAGFRSILTVPLLRPNKVVGALVVRRRTPGEFSDATVRLMETFAAQSVLAIQNARMFSEIEEKGHQLEIASRHKSQFLANMSHELRTPLNSVLGFTEMLSDGLYGEMPEKAKPALTRIEANGKHLLGLINDVLDLSKIEAGQLQLTIEDYSPGQLVKAAAAVTEPLARAKGLTLNAMIADSMPLGRGDERRLTQVLINLAGNAVKFTDTGSVDISARVDGDRFEIAVRDTGPGIAPENQTRIFEEFQQVDDSNTRKKGGSGLGLAISRKIIEMHGGEISVQSALGAGSTFLLSIPIKVTEKVVAR